MKKIDVSSLWGNWPFRRLEHNTVAGLQQTHRRFGVSGGYVASLDSIFYVDPMESEERLAADLAGTEYRQVLTINPTVQFFEDRIDEAAERFNIAAVKIVPGYHGYRLDDDCMAKLYDALLRNRLPLYVVRRIEDVRLNHMIQPRELDRKETEQLPRTMPETKLLYCGFNVGEANSFAELARECPNLYLETSLFKGGVDSVAPTVRALPAGRVLFGSSFPFYCLTSMMMELEESGLDEETLRGVFSENAARFFDN